MIVVRIELWPLGSEERKREIGTAVIVNDGTGDRKTGNYHFQLLKSPEFATHPGTWKKGCVEGFPRLRLGPWDLLYRALRASVEYRNKERS